MGRSAGHVGGGRKLVLSICPRPSSLAERKCGPQYLPMSHSAWAGRAAHSHHPANAPQIVTGACDRSYRAVGDGRRECLSSDAVEWKQSKPPSQPGDQKPSGCSRASGGERDRWSSARQSAAEGRRARRWLEEFLSPSTRKKREPPAPKLLAHGTSCISSPTHKDKPHSAPAP